MNRILRTHLAAAMLLAPAAAVLVASPAAAQHQAVVATPAFHTVALNSTAGLSPGATLMLTVHASPGARSAQVALGRGGVQVPLQERAPGHYVGTHVVQRGDRINPLEPMVLRARYGDRTIAASVSYPPSFQALAMGNAPATPQITHFVLNAGGGIEPGRELSFRLVGSPDGEAVVRVPGLGERIELRETAPGVYTGRYTVRQRDHRVAFDRAVATLEFGERRARADVVVRNDRNEQHARDDSAPRVTNITPANGGWVDERGRVRISAKVSDRGSGVDPASLRLRINGRDVTSDARMRDDEVRYRADLAPGRHVAELQVRDKAGNTTHESWTFTVRDHHQYGGTLPLHVTSHADNAVVDGNGVLTVHGHTAPYASVRVQVESVASLGGIIGFTMPVADQWVRADANGHFVAYVEPRSLPIPGTRYDVNLTATDGTVTAEETLTLYQRRG